MNGFYNVIKPLGDSSSHAVVRLKKILRDALGKKCKVGHLGTLDPMATGVLGIAVGSATKLFDYFLSKRKIYVATCVIGKTTDTLDSAGEIIAEKDINIDEYMFRNVLPRFIGAISQVPPAYSAKSIGGVRAYRLAAKGIETVLPPCNVTIFDIRYLGQDGDNVFRIEIECSGGTYIRSLCRDIGEALDAPAYMGSLERVQNGTMGINTAVSIDSIEKDITSGFTSLETFGENLERLNYPTENAKQLNNGVKMPVAGDNRYVTVYLDGDFYGIGEVKEGYMSLVARENAIG